MNVFHEFHVRGKFERKQGLWTLRIFVLLAWWVTITRFSRKS
jgi:hypothetical protein